MLLAVALLLACTPGLHAQDAWDRAAGEVVRLAPAAFPELPPRVRSELETRGCTIPQPSAPGRQSERQNVIAGEFAARGQTDWAVLCSRGGETSLMVVWGGPVRCPSEHPAQSDRHWLQGDDGGGIDYSRAISAVGEDYIASHHEAYGGPVPPAITHDGIDEAFLGKASQVHYCHEGEWTVLQGAD